jgi:hypothetical protein
MSEPKEIHEVQDPDTDDVREAVRSITVQLNEILHRLAQEIANKQDET